MRCDNPNQHSSTACAIMYSVVAKRLTWAGMLRFVAISRKTPALGCQSLFSDTPFSRRIDSTPDAVPSAKTTLYSSDANDPAREGCSYSSPFP